MITTKLRQFEISLLGVEFIKDGFILNLSGDEISEKGFYPYLFVRIEIFGC